MRTRRLLPLAALALLAGCGGSPTAPGNTTSHETTVAPTSTGAAGEVVLRGRVSAGVEAGCLVLAQGDKQYLLVGGDPEVVKDGAEVEVRAVPKPGLASFCQQGEPVEVVSATPKK